MGEQSQQPAGFGRLFVCPADIFEKQGMDAPMEEIHLAEPARLTPGMLTYEDGDGKPQGGWPSPISFYTIATVTEPSEVLRQLMERAQTFDVTIERKLPRLARKMKKALRQGQRYRRDTKWKRKVANLIRRQSHTLHDCEVVVTPEQHDRLASTIEMTISGKQTDNFQYFEGFADYLHLFQHILRCCCIDIGICYDKVKGL